MAKGSKLDMRGLRKLAQQVGQLGQQRVKVGVLASSGGRQRRGSITMAELATIHEFGSPAANVPERSFIRRTFTAKESEVTAMITRLLGAVVNKGMSASRALELLGAFAAAEVKKTITEGVSPPNAPSTVAKKGSSRPLIDTGRLLGSIQYKVVRRANGAIGGVVATVGYAG